MLWTITVILFILWVVGLVSSYTLGGWIHILLVLAIIVLIFNLMSGRAEPSDPNRNKQQQPSHSHAVEGVTQNEHRDKVEGKFDQK